MMIPKLGTAEAPQNPVRPAGTESGSEQPPAQSDATLLAPEQPAVEPVAAQPANSEPDGQALETLNSEPAAPADEQELGVTEPGPPANPPDDLDAPLAKPPLF
jgi:hypothetical protein